MPKKVARVHIAVSLAEKAAFQAAADRAHLSLSAWIRTRLLRAVRDEDADQRAMFEGGHDADV